MKTNLNQYQKTIRLLPSVFMFIEKKADKEKSSFNEALNNYLQDCIKNEEQEEIFIAGLSVLQEDINILKAGLTTLLKNNNKE